MRDGDQVPLTRIEGEMRRLRDVARDLLSLARSLEGDARNRVIMAAGRTAETTVTLNESLIKLWNNHAPAGFI